MRYGVERQKERDMRRQALRNKLVIEELRKQCEQAEEVKEV